MRKRALGVFSAAALAAAGTVALATPSTALHNSMPPCMVVTSDTTLTGNVGPCHGHGIIIAANNVTVDLAGFTVSGMNMEMEQAGILFDGVSGSTVRNGTVTGFDAGVAIEGGSGNIVTGLTVRDNVNDMIESIDPRSIIVDPETGPTPQQMHDINAVTCTYGDGITTYNSDENTITNNTVVRNGPFSGISLVGDSDRNAVSGNTVNENDLLNNGVVDENGNPVFVQGGVHVPAGTPGATRPQSMCGATEIGTPGMGRGREVQSIGIRVEGPGADRNSVLNNRVNKGGLVGISFHSFILNPAAPNVPAESPSRNNVVRYNTVTRTGADTFRADPFADGIASLSSGPVGTVTHPSDSNTVIQNTSSRNHRHGISLDRLTFNNKIHRNQVIDNGGSGIWLAGPVEPNPENPNFDFRGAHDNFLNKNFGRGNAVFDGEDQNPNCDDNVWFENDFLTFNQPCVVAGSSVAAASSAVSVAGGGQEPPGPGIAHGRPLR